ncbi:Flp family type IVb pilin [Kaistia terrae]|jgi:Flp pilus assembly pilin Flp|uniref:Flp family type IVb pilin n=1 Tax=Kaistia terrae TaxID=537017 RepID=A0ABW0Q2K5_9HYPH|nr:Flp family type IVb pilin [Kaistia terrae]MCX5581240.1 Flp family type IVb pilin [Kaistia terrae]
MNAAAGHSLLRFLRARRGPIALEYGLIIGVIVLALIAVTFTSGGIVALYERVAAMAWQA